MSLRTSQSWERLVTLVVVTLLVVGSLPALALFAPVAAAQETPIAPDDGTETRTGGVVTVGSDETVEGDLQLTGGSVVVAGTVNGDLEAVGGSVVVSGTVTGTVRTVGGSVVIGGDVRGDVDAFGGTVVVRDGARVGGELEASAGVVRLNGEVVGSARLGAEEIVIGPTAVVGGIVEYDADSFEVDPAATIGGGAIRNDELSFTVGSPFGVGSPDFLQPTVSPLAAVGYPFLANLLLGVLVLLLVPGFSRNVVTVGEDDPLTSGGVGLATVVATPLLVVLLAFSIVGIPLALVGFAAFLFALWLGQVYGGYLLGTVAVDRVGWRSRWVALVLGLAVLALLSFLPFGTGTVLRTVVSLLGLGALVVVLAGWVREQRS